MPEFLIDDRPTIDPRGDCQGGDAYAGAVELESHLPNWHRRVRRSHQRWWHMVVGTAMFVERDEEERILEVRAAGCRRRPDGLVDVRQKSLAAQKGRWRWDQEESTQGGDAWRMHVGVGRNHTRFDERVGGQISLFRVLVEFTD